MKIAYISDIHLEFAKATVKPEQLAGVQVLVLAGDIGSGLMGLAWAKQIKTLYKDLLILYVAGNHEFYGQYDMQRWYNRAKKYSPDVEVLNNTMVWGGPNNWTHDKPEAFEKLLQEALESSLNGNDELLEKILEIEKVFFGATAWTDYKIFEPILSQEKSKIACLKVMNDHKYIFKTKRGGIRYIPEFYSAPSAERLGDRVRPDDLSGAHELFKASLNYANHLVWVWDQLKLLDDRKNLEQLARLKNELNTSENETCLGIKTSLCVITHHAPAIECLDANNGKDIALSSLKESFSINGGTEYQAKIALKQIGFDPHDAAYASETLRGLPYVPDVWIHGHIHDAKKWTLNETLVAANPRGYVKPRSRQDLLIDFDTVDLDQKVKHGYHGVKLK